MNELNRRQMLACGATGLIGLGARTGSAAERKRRSTCALELDNRRQPVAGSEKELAAAIRRGADLKINTDFLWHEHIQVGSDNRELVQEVASYQTAYLVEDRWVAGIMSLRQPLNPGFGFGPTPSMSFFMYNQNGQQAIARPFLDGEPHEGQLGPSPVTPSPGSPKYKPIDRWDADTNAPSENFLWEFENFRYLVRDEWEEVCTVDAKGQVTGGSIAVLAEAFVDGAAVKVAIRGLCDDLVEKPNEAPEHEVFVEMATSFYQTESRAFSGGTNPLVRVRPGVPMKYTSAGWDFGWLYVQSDGLVERWLVNPYTLEFGKSKGRYAIRWFVR